MKQPTANHRAKIPFVFLGVLLMLGTLTACGGTVLQPAASFAPIEHYQSKAGDLVLLRTPIKPKKTPESAQCTSSKEDCGEAQRCERGTCVMKPNEKCESKYEASDCQDGSECVLGKCKPKCTSETCPKARVKYECNNNTRATKEWAAGKRFLVLKSGKACRPENLRWVYLSSGDAGQQTHWLYEKK